MKKNKAYTLAELLIVFAMILVAVALMVPALKRAMPDSDKGTIRHTYAQVAQVIASLVQDEEAFAPGYGLADMNTYGEVVYSNGYKLPLKGVYYEKGTPKTVYITKEDGTKGKKTITITNIDSMKDAYKESQIDIMRQNAEVIQRIDSKPVIKEAIYPGPYKFSLMFRSKMNIKETGLEADAKRITNVNKMPICCPTSDCKTNSMKQTANTADCFKNNKGVVFCIPKDTFDDKCLKRYYRSIKSGNTNIKEAANYFMIIKIFPNNKYQNKDGYYLKVYPTGKTAVLPPNMVTYDEDLNDRCPISATGKMEPKEQKKGTPIECGCEETYKRYGQCRLNDYLTDIKSLDK